jgi:prophage regulatory protein
MNIEIKILRNEQSKPAGKLADAEVHFLEGELAGLKLIGFGVWARRDGRGQNVTFPARQFTVVGVRGSTRKCATGSTRLMPRTSVKQSDRKHTWIEQKTDSQVSEDVMNPTLNASMSTPRADRLLNKWAVEKQTSLDITTIYRKMKAGTFPQPVRVGKRRVAWRESDIAAWQAGLEVGTRP